MAKGYAGKGDPILPCAAGEHPCPVSRFLLVLTAGR